MGTSELARLFIVEAGTIASWRRQGMPHKRDSRGYCVYDSEECKVWLSNQTFAQHIRSQGVRKFTGSNKVVSSYELSRIYKVKYSDLYYWRKCGMPYDAVAPKTFFYETKKVHDWLFNGEGWRFGLKLQRNKKEVI